MKTSGKHSVMVTKFLDMFFLNIGNTLTAPQPHNHTMSLILPHRHFLWAICLAGNRVCCACHLSNEDYRTVPNLYSFQLVAR